MSVDLRTFADTGRDPNLPSMRTYLVETYLSRSRAAELEDAAARLSADINAPSGRAVRARYLRSTYVPEDEICFHIFEAVSAEAVREAGERASLTFDRIVEAREGPREPPLLTPRD